MIDVIIPTYRRTALLKRVLPYYLASKDVSSVIIVEDGPLSPEIAALARRGATPRIVTIATGRQSGAPAAKKLGLAHCTAEFAAYGEDDVLLPPDYFSRLAGRVAQGHAQVVAGAIVYLSAIDDAWAEGKVANVIDKPAFGVLRQQNGLRYGLATHAIYLGRREELLRYPPDPAYGGNGWREETDPLLCMVAGGMAIALDPKVICYHLPRGFQQGGGQHARGRLAYEYWCLRNDILFFSKHRAALRRNLGLGASAVWFAVGQSALRWIEKITVRRHPGAPAAVVALPPLDGRA